MQLLQNGNYKEKETLKKDFKPITGVGSGIKHT